MIKCLFADSIRRINYGIYRMLIKLKNHAVVRLQRLRGFVRSNVCERMEGRIRIQRENAAKRNAERGKYSKHGHQLRIYGERADEHNAGERIRSAADVWVCGEQDGERKYGKRGSECKLPVRVRRKEREFKEHREHAGRQQSYEDGNTGVRGRGVWRADVVGRRLVSGVIRIRRNRAAEHEEGARREYGAAAAAV